MANLPDLAPNYARAAARWPSAPTLASCNEALTRCYEAGPHGLVEHVKSFLECFCRTILADFGVPAPPSGSLTDLLVASMDALGFSNARGASKLSKVLSAFNKLSDALTEMRNEAGPVAHGQEGFLDCVSADHARAFVHTGDAILGVLLSALDCREPSLLRTRHPWEKFPRLNASIDCGVAVTAEVEADGGEPLLIVRISADRDEEPLVLRVRPSELLYGLDRDAYIEVLQAVQSAQARTSAVEVGSSHHALAR